MAKPANMEVPREAAAVVHALATVYGPRYLEDLAPRICGGVSLEPEVSARDALKDPLRCLEILYGQYAFSRRGRERQALSEAAVEALHRSCASEAALLRPSDAAFLWEAFVEVCGERRVKPVEELNRGPIQGMAELAQEIYRQDGLGSIAVWIADLIRDTGRVEPQFMRMVDVRGVGPKITSLFLRDVVALFELERHLDPVDRLYTQPVDRWTRLLAPYVVEDCENPADWVLAGKLAKVARKVGVSGVLFNMGITEFGNREARTPDMFDRCIREIHASASPLP